jgi:Oxidoreductase molybdopterin binding domain
VPLATDAPQQTASLFDHLVGGYQQAGRHSQAKGLRSLEVDGRFELCRRLHRQFGGLVAAQDAVDIECCQSKHIVLIGPVGHETAGRDKEMKRVCIEGWSAIGKWTGTPLREFLRRIGADTGAKYVHFVCAEGYSSSIDMAQADLRDADRMVQQWRRKSVCYGNRFCSLGKADLMRAR